MIRDNIIFSPTISWRSNSGLSCSTSTSCQQKCFSILSPQSWLRFVLKASGLESKTALLSDSERQCDGAQHPSIFAELGRYDVFVDVIDDFAHPYIVVKQLQGLAPDHG